MSWLVAALLVIGSGFVLIAAVGVVRLPDLYTRMQALTKAGTVGIGCVLGAVAVHFSDLRVSGQALLVVAFFFLTSPVAAQAIGRAAYVVGVPLWRGTVVDELRPVLGEPPGAARTGDLERDDPLGGG